MSLNIYTLTNKPKFNRPIFLLGSFESFHLGHKSLLDKALLIKSEEPSRDIVLVYFSDIENMHKSNNQLFTDHENRVQQFANLGFENAIMLNFINVKNFSPALFLEKLLSDQEDFIIITGKDFRFGLNAEGDSKYLKNKYHNCYYAIEPLKIDDGNKLSTSTLKEFLSLGEINLVNKFNLFKFSFNANLINENNTINIVSKVNLTNIMPGLYLAWLEYQDFAYSAVLQVNCEQKMQIIILDSKIKNQRKLQVRVSIISALKFFSNDQEIKISDHDKLVAKIRFLNMQ
ncbi:FAD synthase [Mycoplasmopsis opalescens]|uniref:FAD synthase n=1 Tax=Mycoplasmopsis opalescens TaxID=114886 RepID=UPI0004A6BD9A|nr:hypothetical protein [Mycoplasmopsis opalescens]